MTITIALANTIAVTVAITMAMSMAMTIAIALTTAASAASQADEAERDRLVAEMAVLASRQQWKGVEQQYKRLTALVPLPCTLLTPRCQEGAGKLAAELIDARHGRGRSDSARRFR